MITYNNKIKYVSCGSRHSCLITTTGGVMSCGAGDAGQLGTSKRDTEIIPV